MVYKRGDRVALVTMNDPYSALAPGTEGTVRSIDDLGTIHVQWDNGSRLGVVEDAGDRIRKIEKEEDDDDSPGRVA